MNFKEFESKQKLRGGYYTPSDLAEYLVKWVSVTNPEEVLEPSCGDGVFFQHIGRHLKNAKVDAFELNDTEAAKARVSAKDSKIKTCNVRGEDFLAWASPKVYCGREKYDAVLGNPPFIRYQYLPAEFQQTAESVFNALQCKFTRHTNAWVPFILASFALLKDGGRLAMVVPSEIIHVTHAQSLRSYLGSNCSRMVIIDPKEIWFSDTLQGAVILLAEKKSNAKAHTEGLGIYPVNDREFLDIEPERVFQTPQAINGKTVAGKWTRALLDDSARNLLDGLINESSVKYFDEVATVDVGIVTGANKYFLIDNETVERHGLEDWVHPMFGRSDHCKGVIYDSKQHQENAEKGNPTNFLWINDKSALKNKNLKRYIQLGEEQELDKRYKCRVRSPWYEVPSVYSTEIGMLKRSHNAPRLILNKLNAYTTDTAYRIRMKEGTANQFVYGFMNALTAVSAELEGRHYGGGVLELVPSEIEKLIVPQPGKVSPKIRELDKAVKNMPMEEVQEMQTEKVLGKIGVSKNDQITLINSWLKLKNRRQRVDVV